MGLLRNILLVVLGISFLTFVAFFGRLPALRNTPVGSLSRVIWIHIPNGVTCVDTFITGGRVVPGLARCGNYVFFSKHPLVIFVFLGLLTGSAAMFVPPTWALLTPMQKLLVFVVLPPPYYFTYLCQVARPTSRHLVSRDNINEQLPQYPYDYVLYHPNNMCKTCELPKPARSKHCSLCGTCVARCDHHCVWVNNCVGRGNHKYFLALLLSTWFTLAYGTYLAYATLLPQIRALIAAYPEYYLSPPSGQPDLLSRVSDQFKYILDLFGTGLMVGGIRRAGVGMLAAMTWPLPAGLLAYHVYLIWAGMTTNETAKWSEWKEDVADGLVWAADLKTAGAADGFAHADGLRWPHRGKHFLVRTNDGQQPRLVNESIQDLIVPDSWRQVWDLGSVTNIYDLGFWENLRELLSN